MIRTTLALILLLASRPVFAQHQQPHCDNFAYPWQGRLSDGTFALNASVDVPAALPDGLGGLIAGSVYPVDIYFPGPSEPQPTRFSLVSWAHQFPDAPTRSLQIKGYVEIWPRRSATAAHESIAIHPEENLSGDPRPVTKNMSMPMTPGMHYTAGAYNLNPYPVRVNLAVTVQVCFASRWELDQFRTWQSAPGQGASR